MRYLTLVMLAAALLLPPAAAERVVLRDGDAVLAVEYDPVFEINEIYYLDFSVVNGSGYSVEAELPGVPARQRALPANGTASLSFPGATYREARFNQPLQLRLLRGDEVRDNITVEIDVNLPPAKDLTYLWGAMTLLWAGVGGYVVWLHWQQRQLAAQLARVVREGEEGTAGGTSPETNGVTPVSPEEQR